MQLDTIPSRAPRSGIPIGVFHNLFYRFYSGNIEIIKGFRNKLLVGGKQATGVRQHEIHL